MRITVFGATGGTGRHLVEQAREAGHEVTAVVRPTAATDRIPEGVRVERAEVMAPDSLHEAVRGADAVISALGIRPGAKDPVCAPATRAIIGAMRATGTRRLVVVTASGHVNGANDDWLTRTVVKPALWRFLGRNWSDFADTDRVVEASGLEWTILRPSRLTNGGRRAYRREVDGTIRGGYRISRADLADAALAAAGEPGAAGHSLAVAY